MRSSALPALVETPTAELRELVEQMHRRLCFEALEPRQLDAIAALKLVLTDYARDGAALRHRGAVFPALPADVRHLPLLCAQPAHRGRHPGDL